MRYSNPTAQQIAFFREHGYLVVENAIDTAEIGALERAAQTILDNKETMAYDWAWSKDEDKSKRSFRIVQGQISEAHPGLLESLPHRAWVASFAGGLTGSVMSHWYDQFLAKPPQDGATTYWHQDEAYWGRNLDDKGITCWVPLQDVDVTNGCMHFIDGGHKAGILTHRQPAGIQSDLLTCDVDERRMVICPIPVGSVTFHHSKTPHMTTPNKSTGWRKAVTYHLCMEGTREGNHYPWKVVVNQHTGERTWPGK